MRLCIIKRCGLSLQTSDTRSKSFNRPSLPQYSMSISERTRKSLQELGLTEYELRVYTSLLEHHTLTASKISEFSGVPYSKIYEVLASLEKKGWAESEHGRPSKYYPKPPSEAIEASKLRILDSLKLNETQILEELKPLYERKETREKPDIWIVRGEFNVLAKVREVIANTQRELLVAFPAIPEPLVNMAAPLLSHLKETGVATQLLTAKALSNELLDVLTRTGEVRLREQMFGGGVIADAREVMLLLGESGDNPTANLAIWSTHVGLAQFARNYFEYLWKDAKSLNLLTH